ncbi:MAG: hydrogenase maturation nickel metallochaperone HypA [Actinobacteria bacterium]|nr:hydrogenase maturation nickel metallochaperone HypA [Actinomycetota bacterium]
MHEYSITSSLIEIVKRIIKEKNLINIERIDIELNPLSSLEAESIKFYYEFLTKDDDVLRKAKLKFYKTSISIRCSKCQKDYKVKSFPARCPHCHEFNVCKDIYDDIKIKSILAETG